MVFAQKGIIIPEIVNPKVMQIASNNLFITDGMSVYIYSMDDFKLKKRFGQKGEGQSQPEGKVTVSIGVATFPADANSKDGLIEAADSELYRAKQYGGNRVCAFGGKSRHKLD